MFYLYYRIIVVVGAKATVVEKDFLVSFFFFSSSSSRPLSSEVEGDTLFTAFNNIGATSSLVKISKKAIKYILIGMLNS